MYWEIYHLEEFPEVSIKGIPDEYPVSVLPSLDCTNQAYHVKRFKKKTGEPIWVVALARRLNIRILISLRSMEQE